MDDEPSPEEARAPRGRPRRWTDNAEKYREHRARRSALTAAVGELLHAVRNARLDDPGLQQAATHGDDLILVEALTTYYRARHWHWPVRSVGSAEETSNRGSNKSGLDATRVRSANEATEREE
ncbi:MAG TPA: hypothetical protein VK689_10890 [Armatimonadota bacterium]|nr:hypothetical protein [Armatimonadota bacterium]